MVYLYLKVSNDRPQYNPLGSPNRILPYRWTWTQRISEPMLSLSYDYDVLSLGLLKNQASNMVVVFKELQAGCLAELNTTCRDIVIAKALLSITKNLTSSKPSNEGSGVVCYRVLQEFYFGIGGGFKYQCCEEDGHSNENTIHCGLDIKESKWLAVFNTILAAVVVVVFLYWPLLMCAIPDSFFEADLDGSRETNEGEVQTRESLVKTDYESATEGEGTFNNLERSDHTRKSFKKIPVDDLSPITCAMMARICAEKLPTLSHGFNVKLFFLWYCVIPIFFYIKLVLYFIIKSNYFDEASRKLLFQVGDFYLNVFSLDRPLVYVMFIVPLFIIPGVVISSWSPETTETSTSDQTKECCLCGKSVTPQKEILEHVKAMPQFISNELWPRLKDFLNQSKCKILQNRNFHSQQSTCRHAICVLWSVASVLIVAPVVALIIFLVIFFASILCIVIFSPYICIMIITFRFIHKRPIYKWLLFVTLVYSSLSVCIVAIFSCQFVVRMFGFVVMGITLNAEVTVPYVTFVFVVWNNISLCYSNLQKRYKAIKEMISEQWKELTADNSDTIPIDLFWFVCNECNVLPVANEVCRMLWNIVTILIFLIIALSAIFLFQVAYSSSAIVSTIAVFVSGKMSEVFFSKVTTGYSFGGWEKLRTKEMIGSAVVKFITVKIQKKGTEDMISKEQEVVESDSSNVQYETTFV